jgi:hypothetical protein
MNTERPCEWIIFCQTCGISYDKLPEFVSRFGGICFSSAHIDVHTTSVLSVFGMLPDFPAFPVLEVFRPEFFFFRPTRL